MFGSGELLVILFLALLLFGGKRLPELAKSLGEGIKEFKKACNDDSPQKQEESAIEIKSTSLKDADKDQ